MNSVKFLPQNFGGFVFFIFMSGLLMGHAWGNWYQVIIFGLLSVFSFFMAMNFYIKDNK